MTYVSKEAAKALREVGFNKPTTGYFRAPSGHYKSEEVVFMSEPYDHNQSSWLSAPNHLEAADWLCENFHIGIIFNPTFTSIATHPKEIETEVVAGHRDLAILEACKIIKERKSPPPAAG